MSKIVAFVLLISITECFAQSEILVPFRVGDKFGLSDLKGNIKVKPQYDMMEPIGVGYYKCSNNKIGFDKSYRSGGRMIVEEKMIRIAGVMLIFQNIPVFVYRNYMGINGLDIYNLADADKLYFCLQSSD